MFNQPAILLPMMNDDLREMMPTSEEFYADAKAEFGEVVEPDQPKGMCEDAPCCGCCSADGSMVSGGWNGPAHNAFATDGGWPGDGSGVDDLADYNAMEGCDY